MQAKDQSSQRERLLWLQIKTPHSYTAQSNRWTQLLHIQDYGYFSVLSPADIIKGIWDMIYFIKVAQRGEKVI